MEREGGGGRAEASAESDDEGRGRNGGWEGGVAQIAEYSAVSNTGTSGARRRAPRGSSYEACIVLIGYDFHDADLYRATL